MAIVLMTIGLAFANAYNIPHGVSLTCLLPLSSGIALWRRIRLGPITMNVVFSLSALVTGLLSVAIAMFAHEVAFATTGFMWAAGIAGGPAVGFTYDLRNLIAARASGAPAAMLAHQQVRILVILSIVVNVAVALAISLLTVFRAAEPLVTGSAFSSIAFVCAFIHTRIPISYYSIRYI